MSFKLSPHIKPANYDILFDVDMDKFIFSGKESIELEISRPSDKIMLHASGLEAKGAFLMQNGRAMKAGIKLDKEKELLVLSFRGRVKGRAKLHLEFSGRLGDSLLGFYRSKYILNGKEKYLATTQFEAPYARRCFPCFDEPELKATFDVALRIDKNLTAISNMPVKNESAEGGRKTVRFLRTPKMSTYLLYLAVGEFEFLEGMSGRTLVRIATMPGKKEQGGLALELSKKFLEYFEGYSGIKYPLPKLDLIALPDFASGAMENWGAITFREVYLLFDQEMTSTAAKKTIAMIIAHELWHQWSGNLVTMRWWNDLWLNESFATYMAYKAVDASFPEWKMWEYFVSDEMTRAFEDDSLKNTHPIETEVRNPHEIEELFDSISYSKGGSILRMLDNYLGAEVFRKGVSNYLSANKYGNATSEDLWKSLSNVSNKPIKEMMISWIRQPGYPLLSAALEGKALSLKQERFVYANKDKATWLIPLIIRSEKETISELMNSREKKIILQQTPAWVKANYGQSGFYRVQYDDVSKLKNPVLSKTIPELDRWGLQNDLFKISVNGDAALTEYLDFIRSYSDEDNYLVLASIYSSLRSIYFVFCQQDFWQRIWSKFKNHFMEAPRKTLDKLGWEPRKNESDKDALLRELTIRYLAFAEERDVLEKGREKFYAFLKNKKLHPDIKSSVVYIAAVTGDEKVYEKIEDLYTKTQVPEEKRLLLSALGQFRDPRLLERLLDYSLTDKVRTQDLPIVFYSVTSNPMAGGILVKWMKKNWKKLKKYEKSGKLFIALIEALVSSCTNRDNEKELKAFFEKNPVKYRMTLKRSFEKVGRNISWLEKNRKGLERYFA